MAQKPCNKLLAYASVLFACCSTTHVWAGATLDGSRGASTDSFSGNFDIAYEKNVVGEIKGSNLFHSFSDFSINTGESATFYGPGSINNVITRVTGNDPSTFNGALTSLIDPASGPTGANFVFINPNGLIFKENAVLNIGGSFTATTADYVKLGPDGIYYADLDTASTLASSPPSAFGFLDSNPGTISFEGTQLVKFFTLQPIFGPNTFGTTISLIGGDISLDQAPEGTSTIFGTDTSRGTFLSATGSRLELVSVGSAGEAAVTNGIYDLSSFATLGNVDILNGSVIDATETYIKGGKITINNSVVAPGFFFVADMGPPPNGGSVTIEGSEQVNLIGADAPTNIVVNVPPRGPDDPDAGPRLITRFDGGPLFAGVSVFAGDPFLSGPASDVPDVTIQGGNVSLTGSAGIVSQRFGPGTAGNVTVKGDTVEIRNGSLIVNLNTYAGAGGDITINADQVIIDSEGNTTPFTGLTGLLASSNFSPVYGDVGLDPAFNPEAPTGPPNISLIYAPELASGDAGNITVNATGQGGLVVRGGDITTESRAYGNAGDITINASDISLSRGGGEAGAIISQSAFVGDAGQIDVTATGNIDLIDGYAISASTAGIGAGGDVTITAGNNISISGINVGKGSSGIGNSTILPPAELEGFLAFQYRTFFPDYATMAGALTGDPNADILTVLNGLNMSPFADFGDVPIVSGNAGNINVTALALNIDGIHTISSSTSSDGNGGTLNIMVDSLSLDNGAEIRSRSGLIDENSGELRVGTGNGGNISITASNSVTMNNGASISSSSQGTGLAGDVAVDAGNTLEMSNSSITTQATVSDGGNIQVAAVEMIYLEQSDITTSVESGVGAGGNIDIDPDFVILQQSNILANAFGGPGGNINIVAGNFIATPDSSVDASSALGIDGTVNISSPDETVSDDLAVLPDAYLDVTSLIGDRCGTNPGSSSLVDAGPGGRMIDPDGYLPSFVATENYNNKEINGDKSVSNGKRWWAPYAHKQGLQLAQITCTY